MTQPKGPQGTPGLSDATRERLLAAWEAWDARPSSETSVAAMQEACAVAAGELGTTVLTLRDALSEALRHNQQARARSEVLNEVIEGYSSR